MSDLPEGKLLPPSPELFENHSRSAPNFDVAERGYFDRYIKNLDLEGPIAKSNIPVVTLFDSTKPHKANQIVVNDNFELPDELGQSHSNSVRGRLELHYGANGQPESARFVDRDGNVEELKVDQKDPTKLAEDHYDFKSIHVTADFKMKGGQVYQEPIVNPDSTSVTTDIKDGIHYKFQAQEGSLTFAEDRSGRSLEYSATQSTRDEHKADPSFVVNERYEYNDPSFDNGQVSGIVITRLNGDQFRAVRGADGAWQVNKVEPK